MTDTVLTRDPATFSPIERSLLALISPEDHAEAVAAFIDTFTAHERADVLPYSWESLWARPSQLPPDHDDWDTWYIRAGRGAGKSRTLSETVRNRVSRGLSKAVTFIGPTAAEARDVMIEGPLSGLLAVHPPESRPLYEPSKRLLTWPNGAIGHIRSGEDPDALRGLQSDLVAGDEPSSWSYGEDAWNNAMLGNRLGNPKAILTGTPKRRRWLRVLARDTRTVLTEGSTYENISNLAPSFVRLVLDRYEGTRLGLQEIHGRELDDVEGAQWRTEWIVQNALPAVFTKVVIGWDPAVTSKDKSDAHGIVVAGKTANGDVFVIDDLTCKTSPVGAARICLAAAVKYGARTVVIEDNQGKDTWLSVWKEAGGGDHTDVRLSPVSASKSKEQRTIPAATAYERAAAPNPPFRIWHVKGLDLLEEMMTSWVFGEEKAGDGSPDRLDALVWVLHGLGIKAGGTGISRAGSLSAL